MRRATVIALVARRELVERGRSRTFRFATAIQLLLIVALLVIVSLTSGGSTQHVGLVGAASQPYAAPLRASGPSLGATVVTEPVATAAQARQRVHDGKLDAAVIDGATVIVKRDPGSTLAAAIQAVRRELALRTALARAGVPAAQAQRALAPTPLPVHALAPQAKDHDTRRAIASVAIVLLYIAIVTYGMWVAGGVVEEKSSRIVEVVLSAIRPRELLTGKVLGLGLLGLMQFVVVIAVGVVGAHVTSAVHVPSATTAAALLVAAWFVLGFALYACLYAVAGALVSRSEDLQSSAGALNMMSVAAYLVALAGTSNPAGGLLTVASFIPFSAPMAMPARWLLADVPAWQVAASAALTVVTVAALTRVAVRVYEGAVLRLGPRVSLRSALAARRR